MLGQKSIHISTQQFIKSTSQGFEDSISKLPDDLLIEILLLLPTKNAASTIILSKRWRSLFTVLPQDMYFKLLLKVETVTCYHPIDFSLLKGCRICPQNKVDWLQPFMLFLQKSPKIEDLFIVDKTNSGFPLSFNPPISVPECLSMHLKIFEWQGYGGRKAEKEVVKYIFANSTCLITAYISIELTHRRRRGRRKNKLMKELTYMSRVSTSSQLIFPTQSKYDLYFHDDDWSDIFG